MKKRTVLSSSPRFLQHSAEHDLLLSHRMEKNVFSSSRDAALHTLLLIWKKKIYFICLSHLYVVSCQKIPISV